MATLQINDRVRVLIHQGGNYRDSIHRGGDKVERCGTVAALPGSKHECVIQFDGGGSQVAWLELGKAGFPVYAIEVDPTA